MRNTHRTSYPRPQELAEDAQTQERKEDCSRGTIWTDEEVDWLAKNYRRFPGKFCAEYLRRSYNAVRIMVCRMKHGRVKPKTHEKIKYFGNVSRMSL